MRLPASRFLMLPDLIRRARERDERERAQRDAFNAWLIVQSVDVLSFQVSHLCAALGVKPDYTGFAKSYPGLHSYLTRLGLLEPVKDDQWRGTEP